MQRPIFSRPRWPGSGCGSWPDESPCEHGTLAGRSWQAQPPEDLVAGPGNPRRRRPPSHPKSCISSSKPINNTGPSNLAVRHRGRRTTNNSCTDHMYARSSRLRLPAGESTTLGAVSVRLIGKPGQLSRSHPCRPGSVHSPAARRIATLRFVCGIDPRCAVAHSIPANANWLVFNPLDSDHLTSYS